MPSLTCPRCQRANPGEAVYCHFDGVVLRQGPEPRRLDHEFVFPSGRRCRNFDDLVQGCYQEWEEARRLLREGGFSRFLTGVGRMDLARAAQEAQGHADADIALHNFINSLPANQAHGPRLDLSPRRLNLGALRAGETRQVRLTVSNQGKGFLQGTLHVSEGSDWLHIAEADGTGACSLRTPREQQVTLRIDTRNLPAPQSYSGKLTAVTNGGVAEVPVRMDLGSHPFPRPPFVGVSSPREMAERMRTQPKPAVALLESGDVQRWFAANGWAYPVQGPTAKGVAAVQQFFEGMGLSKPPALALSATELQFSCVPQEVVRGQVTLTTAARKWVYAFAEADVPWLRVLTPNVSGAQRADVEFEVDAGLADPGVHDGTLHLLANAGQRLAVRVRLEVYPPHEPFTRRLLKPFFLGALLGLLYRLVLVLPADLFARLVMAPPEARAGAGSLVGWSHSPVFGDGNILRLEFVKYFVLATWWVGALGGALLLWRRGSRWSDVLCGLVAGAFAGLAGAATFACLLDALDGVPRTVMALLGRVLKSPDPAAAPQVWTAVWIVVAILCWGVMGGVIGFVLAWAGQGGARLLEALAAPWTWACRTCGLKGASAFFVP